MRTSNRNRQFNLKDRKHRAPSGQLNISFPAKLAEISNSTLGLILLGLFILIQICLPLASALQIGADEGFELSKATLRLHGFVLYRDVWNDQPPLHTVLITFILKYLSPSVLGPRLLTIVCAAILLASIYRISLTLFRKPIMAASTVLLALASPAFIELSASCMLELPALALSIASLTVLFSSKRTPLVLVVSGALFALSLQIKLVTMVYLPIAAFLLALPDFQFRRWFRESAVFGFSLLVLFSVLGFTLEQGAFFQNLDQSWASHFGTPRSNEYGGAADYPYDWSVLLKNWDATLLALIGVVFFAFRIKENKFYAAPPLWATLTIFVFQLHRPWWPYYYVHHAAPFALCAVFGGTCLFTNAAKKKSKFGIGMLAVFTFVALTWINLRIYLQIRDIRHVPMIHSTLVVNEILGMQQRPGSLYSDESILSFYTGVPLIPNLAVMPLKRLWTGEMNNEKIRAEVEVQKPDIIILRKDNRPTPVSDLVASSYRQSYEDKHFRLFVRKDF